MFTFTDKQRYHALIWLAFWHIAIIASSNFLVQLPIEIGNLTTTWGAFTFPFIFLTTDLTVRIFGQALARKIIFWAMIPALIISYVISVLFHNGQFTGLNSLAELNLFVGRIALASMTAYLIGQLLDIVVFNRLRKNARWWVAPGASTILGNAVDTLIFFAVAFWHSQDAFMASHWPEIALVDYGWKLLISLVLFLPFYGWLLQRLIARLTLQTTPVEAQAKSYCNAG